jgi:hypothetical protein
MLISHQFASLACLFSPPPSFFRYLKDSGLTYASTRYAYDYDQFADSSFMSIKESPIGSGKYVWKMAVDEHKPIPFVNPEDAGFMIADMFNDKEKYKGQIVDVASELLTPTELVSSFSRVSGLPCDICMLEDAAAVTTPLLEPDVGSMMQYYNLLDTSGFDSSINALRLTNPNALTFDTWQAANPLWYQQAPVVYNDVDEVDTFVKIVTTTTTTTDIPQVF